MASARNVSAYSLVQATVRALYALLLTPETWATLIRAGDFDTVLSILSRTAYGPHLQLDRRILTPRRAVYQMRLHLTEAYEKLIRITPEPGKALLLQLWRAYEVDNLKATLRGIENRATWERVRFLLAPTIRHAALKMSDMERMIRTESIERAIERIRHTPYYDTLVHALDRYYKEKSLFPLEVALDLDYRRAMWQAIERLDGTDRAQALRLIGTMLDADNLLWAIRYRVYHRLSEQEIINYTLPMGYQVRDADIRAIARGADIAQIVSRIYPEADGLAQFAAGDERDGLIALERFLERRLVQLCRATFLGEPFHIGLPLAYLLLSEQEIRQLTTIVEAKASGVSQSLLESMLIGADVVQ